MTASRENVSFSIHFFQLIIVNPFPYTFPIKNQCFLVLTEMYFLKYLISIFFISPFSKCFLFLLSRSYHIVPHLSIDILHKNYILELYKMTMGYSVQIQKKLQCRSEALRAPQRRFCVQTCFYMPDLFIPLYTFHAV